MGEFSNGKIYLLNADPTASILEGVLQGGLKQPEKISRNSSRAPHEALDRGVGDYAGSTSDTAVSEKLLEYGDQVVSGS